MNRSNNINKIAAVIPFYNESKTINEVIEKTLKQVDYIFAIDDGSTDNSIQKFTSKENVLLIRNSFNRGKGYALRTGMRSAIDEGFEKIVTLDADLQHNPDEIPLLLSGLKDYHIVIGNRLSNLCRMPLQRRMSNKITSKLLSIKTGQEAESEILIKSARLGYKIGFVNISTIYGEEKSKMNGLKTTIDFIRLLFL
ncbi:MAG: glycosyltransferase family 2 protein [Ignavibacteriaceae bacterium]